MAQCDLFFRPPIQPAAVLEADCLFRETIQPATLTPFRVSGQLDAVLGLQQCGVCSEMGVAGAAAAGLARVCCTAAGFAEK